MCEVCVCVRCACVCVCVCVCVCEVCGCVCVCEVCVCVRCACVCVCVCVGEGVREGCVRSVRKGCFLGLSVSNTTLGAHTRQSTVPISAQVELSFSTLSPCSQVI